MSGDGEDDVRTVRLTIIQPEEQAGRQLDVFCDVQNLGPVWDSKAIVSADLVNSLNEACRTRQDWFQQVHEELVTCRLGFYCDLHRLRQVIWRMHETVHVQLHKRESKLAPAHLDIDLDSQVAEDVPANATEGIGSPYAAAHDGAESTILTESPVASSPLRASFRSTGQASPSPSPGTTSRLGSKVTRGFTSFHTSQKSKLSSDDDVSIGSGSEQDNFPDAQEVDLCPVYFFTPEFYLDSYETEMRDLAIKTFNAELIQEARRFQDLIESLGVGSWKQLLQYFIRQGFTLAGVAREMVKSCEDQDYVRLIRNNFSGGLMDATDAMLKRAEELQPERDALSRRDGLVENAITKNRGEVYALEDELKELIAQRPKPQSFGNEDDLRAKRREAVSQRRQVLAQEVQEREERAMADFARFAALEKHWQQEVQLLEDDEKDMLKTHSTEVERKSRVLQVQLKRYAQREQEARDKIHFCMEEYEKNKAEVARLRAKLDSIPKADPVSLQLKRLQRELSDLHAEQEGLRDAMQKLFRRIKAMRVELRVLYEKLGWDLDFSESESEEEDEQPYWKRRQLATDGFLPFDATLFAYSEQHFRRKRKAKRMAQHHAMVEGIFQAQMNARRIHVKGSEDDTSAIAITINGKEDPALSYINLDPASVEELAKSTQVDTAPTTTAPLRRVPGAAGPPAKDVPWRHDEKEIARHCTQLVQLARCAATFDAQLQRVAEHFLELLPATGGLGHIREKLDSSLRELSTIPPESSALGEDSAIAEQSSSSERYAETLHKTLHESIQEAISFGDEIHEIREAMRHAVVFGAIQRRFTEVQGQVRELRLDLKAAVGSDISLWSSKSSLNLLDTNHPIRSSSMASLGSPPSKESKLKTGRLVQPFMLNALESEAADSAGVDSKMLAHMDSTISRHSADEIDFGFRPDGVGEESLENWSLFKVSYGPSGGGQDGAERDGQTRKADSRLRRQRGVADGSFHEYMKQRQQGIEHSIAARGGIWKSPSMPTLTGGKQKNSLCRLPELVKAGAGNPSQVAVNGMPQAAARTPPQPARAVDRSWQFGNPTAQPAA